MLTATSPNSNQKSNWSEYAVSAVMEINISMYCGMRNAERCSAVPVPEYTWVKNTCGREGSMGLPEVE